MATGTNVTIHDGAHQFRGVFGNIWVVQFTLDSASIGSNSATVDTVTVPGLRRATDVVLGFTHSAASDAEVGDELFVSANDTLGIRRHNMGAGPNDPASSVFRVVIGRIEL